MSRKRAKFLQKSLNSMVVGARQSFQFADNNRALSKFLYGFLHYLLVLPNYEKISP